MLFTVCFSPLRISCICIPLLQCPVELLRLTSRLQTASQFGYNYLSAGVSLHDFHFRQPASLVIIFVVDD